MTHQAVEVGLGRTQYIFTEWAAEVVAERPRHPVLAFLQIPRTAVEIAEQFNYSKAYVTQLLGTYRQHIEGAGFVGHSKIYRAKP